MPPPRTGGGSIHGFNMNITVRRHLPREAAAGAVLLWRVIGLSLGRLRLLVVVTTLGIDFRYMLTLPLPD